MQFPRFKSQKICIFMMAAILLTGAFNGTTQGTAFLSCPNPNTSSVTPKEPAKHSETYRSATRQKSQSYRMARIFLAEEDYRLEETTAKLLKKVNSFRKENKRSIGRRRIVYLQPAQYLAKGRELLQKQAIHRAKSIIRIQDVIIQYIHRKDGAKGTRFFS